MAEFGKAGAAKVQARVNELDVAPLERVVHHLFVLFHLWAMRQALSLAGQKGALRCAASRRGHSSLAEAGFCTAPVQRLQSELASCPCLFNEP